MAAPPLEAGAVHVTVACPFPAVALTLVGAPGGAAGVTLLDGTEAGLLPAQLAAVTVKVYVVPLVSPLTVAVVVVPLAVVKLMPPGDEVTV